MYAVRAYNLGVFCDQLLSYFKNCPVCVQIGLMGLIEWEWIETLATLEPEDVDYTDYVEAAKTLVPQLEQEVSHYLTCAFV